MLQAAAINAARQAYEQQRLMAERMNAIERARFLAGNPPMSLGVQIFQGAYRIAPGRYQCRGCGAPSEQGRCSYCLTPSC